MGKSFFPILLFQVTRAPATPASSTARYSSECWRSEAESSDRQSMFSALDLSCDRSVLGLKTHIHTSPLTLAVRGDPTAVVYFIYFSAFSFKYINTTLYHFFSIEQTTEWLHVSVPTIMADIHPDYGRQSYKSKEKNNITIINDATAHYSHITKLCLKTNSN